jgi:hypothetical protein
VVQREGNEVLRGKGWGTSDDKRGRRWSVVTSSPSVADMALDNDFFLEIQIADMAPLPSVWQKH